jgi:hypothetical protein
MILCGECNQRPFISLLASLTLYVLVPSQYNRTPPPYAYVAPPLANTNNKIFLPPSFAPLPLAPWGNCPLNPLAPPLRRRCNLPSQVHKSYLQARHHVWKSVEPINSSLTFAVLLPSPLPLSTLPFPPCHLHSLLYCNTMIRVQMILHWYCRDRHFQYVTLHANHIHAVMLIFMAVAWYVAAD